jgi:hypothetical protein
MVSWPGAVPGVYENIAGYISNAAEATSGKATVYTGIFRGGAGLMKSLSSEIEDVCSGPSEILTHSRVGFCIRLGRRLQELLGF